ncbi:MAG: phage exclusion protein Lit family protein [Pirellulales bacterium]
MKNPIHFLLDHFFASLAAISPEKADDLKREVAEHGIAFVIEDTEKPFFFLANPETKTITAGVGCLGRLWATAYGYFCLYQAVADAKSQNADVRELDLKANERIEKASRLLEWTVNIEMALAAARRSKEPTPQVGWPNDLPKPIPNPIHASDEHVTDELFLCAAAYILHHELAHIRLGHISSPDSDETRKLEEQADEAAARWILGGLDENDPRFLKRALGVALALSWLASLAVFVPEDQKWHPPSCDRLVAIIEMFVKDPNHLVWAFVGTVLRANLEARSMIYDKNREATSFKDDAQYCIGVFKKYQAK